MNQSGYGSYLEFAGSGLALPRSLKRLVRDRLAQAAAHYWQDEVREHFPDSNTLPPPQTIPLKREKSLNCITYTSAIALRLAKIWDLCPFDVARKLTGYATDFSGIWDGAIASVNGYGLDNLDNSSTAAEFSALSTIYIWIDCTAHTWLQCRIDDVGVAEWLQILTESAVAARSRLAMTVGEGADVLSSAAPAVAHPLIPGQGDRTSLFDGIRFEGLYAHARCCSVLKLADAAGLITLSHKLPADCSHPLMAWQIQSPSPLPWLKPSGQLHFRHPSEQALLSQLIEVVDELDAVSFQPGGLPRDRLTKLLDRLSQAFAGFYAECRLLDAGEGGEPHLRTQARLGLVNITRSLLRELLENQLGAVAPNEL